jgi:hypothetical protein
LLSSLKNPGTGGCGVFLALKAVKDLFGDIIRDITVALYQLSCTVFRCYKRERKHE